MHSDLPSRQKLQRLVNRKRDQRPTQYFAQYKQRARNITSANELLPGLNDISDAFEALPMDLVKYFTLLKEIDAKCINTVPAINRHIDSYIESLHSGEGASASKLSLIRRHVHEVIPCLEEKMHVTLVAADVVAKHLFRINNDYRVVTGNNEIPESVRLGPPTHRAIVLDPNSADSKLAQLQRLESRREALAARKATRDDDDDEDDGKRRRKEIEPFEHMAGKRRREEKGLVPPDKKRKPKDEKGLEPTYCYCDQVSFGEMVGCDGDTCKREWFHLPCIGFKNPPKGKWYCDECLVKMKKAKR